MYTQQVDRWQKRDTTARIPAFPPIATKSLLEFGMTDGKGRMPKEGKERSPLSQSDTAAFRGMRMQRGGEDG